MESMASREVGGGVRSSVEEDGSGVEGELLAGWRDTCSSALEQAKPLEERRVDLANRCRHSHRHGST